MAHFPLYIRNSKAIKRVHRLAAVVLLWRGWGKLKALAGFGPIDVGT